jgi:hypothetical protein
MSYVPEPIPMDKPFSFETLQEATDKSQTDPAALTDNELDHWASYDLAGARLLARRREQARAARPKPPAPAVASSATARTWTAEARRELFNRGKRDGWKTLSRDEQAALFAPVSFVTLFSLEDLIADHLNEMNDRNKTRNERLDALEARPAGAPGVEYRGVFRDGDIFEAGQLATRRGGLWLCLKRTAATPGTAPGAWRLICKEGQAHDR